MKNPATPAWRSLRAAALVLILLAAACSESDGGPATAAPETAGTTETQQDPEMGDMVGSGQNGGGHHDDASTGTDDTHDHDHDHGSAGEPTRYDADVADAVQTITVDAVDGAPVGGVRRVEVDAGSVVALMVTSDIAEEVHVHGYDILRAVSDGHPAHFAFTAEIPGVFEVEFEGSGRLFLQLEIS